MSARPRSRGGEALLMAAPTDSLADADADGDREGGPAQQGETR